MKIQRFVMTKEHLKLMRRMYVDWWDCEFGAPAINPKRPYGNSDVLHDIHEILTGETIGRTDSKRDELTERESRKYAKLHQEMQTALQVALSTGSFKVGKYEAEEYGQEWHRV